MTHISNNGVIVGAGWLGEPLAEHLKTSGWHVIKTSRQQKNQKGWVQFNLEQHICDINLTEAVWFFCIPPGRTAEAQRAYQEYLEKSLAEAKAKQASRFIFCSTTGIYPDEPLHFTELDAFEAKTEKQSRLLQNERIVAESGLNTVIVRLGGLMGSKRHPGRFLSGKSLSSSANATVNMLHQKDAVNGLQFIAEIAAPETIINLVTPHHPTKAVFYGEATKQLGMLPVRFEKAGKEPRIISSELLLKLGFKFEYADLFDALQNC